MEDRFSPYRALLFDAKFPRRLLGWSLIGLLVGGQQIFLGAIAGMHVGSIASVLLVALLFWTVLTGTRVVRHFVALPRASEAIAVVIGLRCLHSVFFCCWVFDYCLYWTYLDTRRIWLAKELPTPDDSVLAIVVIAAHFLVMTVSAIVLAIVLRLVIVRFIAPPPPGPGICITCGYDLRASKDQCPECGTPIPDTLARQPIEKSGT